MMMRIDTNSSNGAAMFCWALLLLCECMDMCMYLIIISISHKINHNDQLSWWHPFKQQLEMLFLGLFIWKREGICCFLFHKLAAYLFCEFFLSPLHR